MMTMWQMTQNPKKRKCTLLKTDNVEMDSTAIAIM